MTREPSTALVPLSDGSNMKIVGRTSAELLDLYHAAQAIHDAGRVGICVELSDGTVVAGVPQTIRLCRNIQFGMTWFEMTVWPVESDGQPQHFDSRHIVRLERVDPTP